ncbi:MAG TPA: GNAT family N-acetyltransferase [Ruminococcus flavefaciens]|nr:GNAT family N-acetyltransferase [Ruminococcus flavefaciens]HQL99932.1 GNAT family N-acetyltransferase [Ruminococcus flavefaciens]
MIETEILLLREMNRDDFDALFDILSDAETMAHYPSPFDEEKVRSWIAWNIDNYRKYGFGLWSVVLKECGKVIGDCGVTMQNIDGDILPEIGYHINRNYWRKGYGSEAAEAVKDWMFENTDFDILYSYMKYTNIASAAVAESVGMTKIKEFPDNKNGMTYVYSISRAQWESGRS